ncbi:MAG: hypothetical protein M0R46_13735 [Candidatus Muirbacterium halophilum]|nr:hypothetical protein [Candidatus Muirbacterium halophilum]MCK9476984.1 hypothetical protein [Candidatus Muirbacterium halophilum]
MNCPYCQSDIHDKAIKCPYCHSYILQKKKDKSMVKIFNSVFLGVFLAVIGSFLLISICFYNFYDIFLIRYDYKSANECSINCEYLTEAVKLYNDVNSDTIFSLNSKDMFKLKKFLSSNEFVKPDCPLNGIYFLDDNGNVSCTKHKNIE